MPNYQSHIFFIFIFFILMIAIVSRGGTIPEITMRYVSRYLSHNTIRITILR